MRRWQTVTRDVWVDFNSADGRGNVTTLRKFAEPGTDFTVGSTVRAGDDDGNVCDAHVIGVDERTVLLGLNYGTFQAMDDRSSLLV